MEGKLRRYKNFVSGYKQCYAKILKINPDAGENYLVVQSGSSGSNSSPTLRIPLKKAIIELRRFTETETRDDSGEVGGAGTEFTITNNQNGKKKIKHHFKAESQ